MQFPLLYNKYSLLATLKASGLNVGFCLHLPAIAQNWLNFCFVSPFPRSFRSPRSPRFPRSFRSPRSPRFLPSFR